MAFHSFLKTAGKVFAVKLLLDIEDIISIPLADNSGQVLFNVECGLPIFNYYTSSIFGWRFRDPKLYFSRSWKTANLLAFKYVLHFDLSPNKVGLL